jgi:hypothetical protein
MNIFDTAAEYYQKNPLPQIQDKRRKLFTNQLELVIETAPFLSHQEKKQLLKLIPIYPTSTIKNVKESLINQGITYFRLNKTDEKSINDWLQKINQQS